MHESDKKPGWLEWAIIVLLIVILVIAALILLGPQLANPGQPVQNAL